MKPISEADINHIQATLTQRCKITDAHTRGCYLQGASAPMGHYNNMLRFKFSEDKIVKELAEFCGDIFFKHGYGRDDRIEMMAAAAEWPQEFTAKVNAAIDLEEQKYQTKPTERDAFFATRAQKNVERGGYETRWRAGRE